MVSKESQEKTKVVEEKKHDTQVVVSNMQPNSFIIIRKFGARYSVITPFFAYERENGDTEWCSDFNVPNNRLFRIQNLFNNIPAISSYKVYVDKLQFNCLENFPPNIFSETLTSGWIHFNYKASKETDKSPDIIEIEDRVIFEQIDDTEIDVPGSPFDLTFEQTNKIKFEAKDLKVFPVIFKNGFALTVADGKSTTLYLTLENVEKMFCGVTSQSELNNLIHNIFPLFPYFNCNVNDRSANIFLQNKDVPELRSFLKRTGLKKALLRFQYFFNEPTTCNCRIIGR